MSVKLKSFFSTIGNALKRFFKCLKPFSTEEDFHREDIKWQAPLSYRYLRIIAWATIVFAQIATIQGFVIGAYRDVPTWLVTVFSTLGSVGTPLLLIASFTLIINGRRSYSNMLSFYGGISLLIIILYIFFYERYFVGIASNTLMIPREDVEEYLRSHYGDKLNLNMFIDFFLCSLFYFFINYEPKKAFQGKKIIIFRLLSILPVAYCVGAYVLRLLINTRHFALPIDCFPLLTSKSPLLIGMFFIIILYIKVQHNICNKNTSSKEEANKMFLSNRSSLKMSIVISILLILVFLVDLTMFLVFTNDFLMIEDVALFMSRTGIGKNLSVWLCIPFILLYSFSKLHKQSSLDMVIPMIGAAACILVIIDGIYQMVVIFTTGG